MRIPTWDQLVLADGILREPAVDAHHLALWVRGSREPEVQHWERIANVARAEITRVEGFCTTPATVIHAEQRLHGFFGRLRHRLRGPGGRKTWTLPTGDIAEQCGDRQTDLVLAWAEEDASPLEETRIRSHWPATQRVQQLAVNLFLVCGIASPTDGAVEEASPLPEVSRVEVEQRVTDARRSGNRRAEVVALTDLGIAALRAGQASHAVAVLEKAVTLAREIGDRSGAIDAEGNLGLALLEVGQPRRALELFERERADLGAADDPFARKAALFHLGLAWAHLGDPGRAFHHYDLALELARQLGDRPHEADLLWRQGIQFAEVGQRDQALARGEEAVALMQQLGQPQAGWFAEQLRKYRAGEAGSPPPAPLGRQSPPVSGPGLLRMAVSAGRAMARFVGSGCQRVSPEFHQQRLQVCANCTHHTGLRCRLCGCFTNVKAWMRHEDCPIGKWPRR